MVVIQERVSHICKICFRQQSRSALALLRQHRHRFRAFHAALPKRSRIEDAQSGAKEPTELESKNEEEEGAMSRRLEEMTQEGLESSGLRADKVVREAGFSDELKRKLEARLLDAKFRSDHPAAFAAKDMPSSAGKGTRDIAAARPWTGTETLENAAFRMLDDAHKPLRVSGGKSRIPSPVPVDLRPKQKDTATGAQRLANARDKTSIYSLAKDNTMSDKEKQELRKQFKDRFAPGARSIPATIQGLQGVASQRIEDAIARGLFKNIPRGKGVNTTRDHNADSPFIDTTEYFMNKIVKKQELTPPWIEKQAEIHRAASVFRSRLRADWKRHAARTIASKGGSIEDQIQRAMEYAEAEAIENSPPVKREIMTGIDNQGNLTRVKIEEQSPGSDEDADVKIIVTETEAPQSPATKAQSEQPQPMALEKVRRAPFRDPSWEALESSYHTLAVTQLNNLTRSYNLMAPDLAKKPYYSLQRELRSCYGEVAPQLSDEIRERSRAPRAKIEVVGHRPGGVMEKFGAGETAKVYDDRRAPYGFKEFWRDLFNAGKQGV